jgi:hypothetical protein
MAITLVQVLVEALITQIIKASEYGLHNWDSIPSIGTRLR